MKHLKALDQDQKDAVLLTTDDYGAPAHQALLIQAGPGSGKTRLLTACVAHAVATGTSADEILLLSFGRKAAGELRDRLQSLQANGIDCDGVTCTTFHGFAFRVVREFHADCDLAAGFTLATRVTTEMLLSLARRELTTEHQALIKRLTVTQLRHILSFKANARTSISAALTRVVPRHSSAEAAIKALRNRYQRLKREHNVVDFDDLLRLCLRLLRVKQIGKAVRARFSRVLVDEYQDTSRVQARILQQVRPSGRGVVLVGDVNQAIFSFRGAAALAFDRAKQLFTNRPRVVQLSANYRSTRSIVQVCNALVSNTTAPMQALGRKGVRPVIRDVADGTSQAKAVATAIQRSLDAGVPLREQAVLVRLSASADRLVKELDRLAIRFVRVGGERPSDSDAVTLIVQCLSWLLNPKDTITGRTVVEQVLQVRPKVARLLCVDVRRHGLAKAAHSRHLPTKARSSWATLASISKLIRGGSDFNGTTVIRTLRMLADAKLFDLSQAEEGFLLDCATGSSNWVYYLDALAAVDEDATSPQDAVTISTIHSAKGREWNVVRMLDVTSGVMPFRPLTREDVEEERRLLFVATSRARVTLELFVPKLVSIPGYASTYNANTQLSPLLDRKALECFARPVETRK